MAPLWSGQRNGGKQRGSICLHRYITQWHFTNSALQSTKSMPFAWCCSPDSMFACSCLQGMNWVQTLVVPCYKKFIHACLLQRQMLRAYSKVSTKWPSLYEICCRMHLRHRQPFWGKTHAHLGCHSKAGANCPQKVQTHDITTFWSGMNYGLHAAINESIHWVVSVTHPFACEKQDDFCWTTRLTSDAFIPCAQQHTTCIQLKNKKRELLFLKKKRSLWNVVWKACVCQLLASEVPLFWKFSAPKQLSL